MEPEHKTRPAGPNKPPKDLVMHGVSVVVLLFLIWVAGVLIFACAVVQFFWMIFSSERNEGLMRLGAGLGNWAREAVRFVTGVADDRPFPWRDWSEHDRG